MEVTGTRFPNSLDRYDKIFIGDKLCDPRDPETNEYYGGRVKCHVTAVEAGGVNATLNVTLNRGTAWAYSPSLYPGPDWTLSMFELFPGQ